MAEIGVAGDKRAVTISGIPIVKAIRRERDGQRQNLVFGWANVPFPGTSDVAKDIHVEGGAVEGSLEHQAAQVRRAYREQFADREGEWSDVVATFVDEKRVVVAVYRVGGNTDLFGISYEEGDDGIEFVFPMQALSVELVEKLAPGAVARAEVMKVEGHPTDQPKTDLDGDQIPIEELEHAAYDFVLSSGRADVRHQEEVRGQLVESFVVTEEKLIAMGISEDVAKAAPKGWWGGFLTDDETYDRVESGELRMFSIGGTAQRVEEA